MKKLIMVGGPAGVGKTTVCKELFQSTPHSAWLDGDWCWMVNPYPGKTDEQKRYAEETFGRILDGYMNDENTTSVFFSWLMHSDFMFDLVTKQISHKNYALYKIVLVCEDAGVFVERMKRDGRRDEQVNGVVDMDAYRKIDACAIDVSKKTPLEVANEIVERVNNHELFDN